jgi:hypothetical protein
MKDAKSMYRGGDVVEAKHCDFDSSRLLGLVCPFCNEAVYLRAGTSRIGKNRTSLVNPSFCHYPGSAEDLDCERRSISAEGRETIEQIKAEKRGQRLGLYNKHLWDMIGTRSSYKSKHPKNSKAVNLFTESQKQSFLKEVKSKFKINHEWFGYVQHIKSLTDLLETPSEVESYFVINKNKAFDFHALAHIIAITGEISFHQSVCLEVCDFLQCKSSSVAFKNIFLVGLSNSVKTFSETIPKDFDRVSIQQSILEAYKNYFSSAVVNIAESMFELIFFTPWEAQIERFSNPDRKAADEKYFALLDAAKGNLGQ